MFAGACGDRVGTVLNQFIGTKHVIEVVDLTKVMVGLDILPMQLWFVTQSANLVNVLWMLRIVKAIDAQWRGKALSTDINVSLATLVETLG